VGTALDALFRMFDVLALLLEVDLYDLFTIVLDRVLMLFDLVYDLVRWTLLFEIFV